MTLQKLIILFVSLCGGALGLFAPIGFVKWLLQTEPEDAGILTLFFVPVWCLLLVLAHHWRQAAPCNDSWSSSARSALRVTGAIAGYIRSRSSAPPPPFFAMN